MELLVCRPGDEAIHWYARNALFYTPQVDIFLYITYRVGVASFPGPAQLSVAWSTESLGTRLG